MEFEEIVGRYHLAADEFSRGDAEPVMALLSDQEDVTLANPFGPPVRGRRAVSEALGFAASRFRDGSVTAFERVAAYVGADLACILEIEHWTAQVGGRDEPSDFVLRVTSTFRREADGWRLVHRHADPIATADVDGPLRAR